MSIINSELSPPQLQNEIVIDPRMEIFFGDAKGEKDATASSQMLTPRMFDNDLTLPAHFLDLTPVSTSAGDSINVAAMVTPETPPSLEYDDDAACNRQVGNHGNATTNDRTGRRSTKKKKPASIASSTTPSKHSTRASSSTLSFNRPFDAGGGDDRRNRCLERNRIAASKCREKKKVWVAALEDTKTQLESHHSALRREHANLVAECARVKNSLMEHANCHDGNIDAWLENEATKFVKRRPSAAPTDERKDSVSENSNSSPDTSGSGDSIPGRHASIGSVLPMSCNGMLSPSVMMQFLMAADPAPAYNDDSAVLLSSPDVDAMNYDFINDDIFPDAA